MQTYERIITEVEARKYEGPRLTVVNDELGEQFANSGDYLVGTERGKIQVIPAAKFEAEFRECEVTRQQQIDDLTAQLAAEKELNAEANNLIALHAAKIAELEAPKAPELPPAA